MSALISIYTRQWNALISAADATRGKSQHERAAAMAAALEGTGMKFVPFNVIASLQAVVEAHAELVEENLARKENRT